MDSYSILDKSPAQAGRDTAPPSLVSLDKESAAKASALPPVRESMRFPGDDGGKSLSEMAQRDLDATLQLLAERAQYISGASGAAIALRQDETMVCCASSGPSAPELGAHLQIDSGLSGESVRTRQVLHCDDAENDPRVNRDSCRAFGIASVVVMPLMRGEEVYGVFELLSGRPRAFEERDFIALNRLAEMIQTAVEHSDAARRAEKELSRPATAVLATVEAELPEPSPDLTGGILETSSGSAPLEEVSKDTRPAESHEVVLASVSAVTEKPAAPSDVPAAVNSSEPISTIAFGNLRRCDACGFPVSEGRKLCLDCEASSPAIAATGLDDLSIFAEESGRNWVQSHLYLIASAVIAVATIALLLWRL